MKVEIKLFANLRDLVKRKILVEELPSESDVSDLIRKLGEQLGPEFAKQALDDQGEPSKSVRILINGRNIAFLQGAATKLKDGDVVAIFPPVAGGRYKLFRVKHQQIKRFIP